ncbi:hypothetical protein B0H13DRAFT_2466654, partial [Mycena leptocephala]
LAALASVATLVSTVGAIPKITRTGQYLYADDGTRFFVKGIKYQTQGPVIPGPDNPLNQPSTFVDQLADSAGCTRDLPFLQAWGINVGSANGVVTPHRRRTTGSTRSSRIIMLWRICAFFLKNFLSTFSISFPSLFSPREFFFLLVHFSTALIDFILSIISVKYLSRVLPFLDSPRFESCEGFFLSVFGERMTRAPRGLVRPTQRKTGAAGDSTRLQLRRISIHLSFIFFAARSRIPRAPR